MNKKKKTIYIIIILILLMPKPYSIVRILSVNELLGMPVGDPIEKGFCFGVIYPKKNVGWDCFGYKVLKKNIIK
ncbi:MAG: hypothetical protein HOA57_04210 [Candidatus Magasanikbacteria bacterium]|jgi:hypothetical protein|nr:hypothetical protein [Candidatus Magasanikbacteria bacterium]MBT4547324.1 hypothetical protein [Candidatus Magasanikbacteria bacterium]MBT6819551.1 hypothetical protein [Candidatus Magasanikbacteria bacterium]